MQDTKRRRKEEQSTHVPPLLQAFGGDSLTSIGIDMEYASLQGLSTIPNVATVQYEAGVVIPRTQGFDLRMLAMVQGLAIVSPTLTFPPSDSFSVSLTDGWSTMVQTKSATITPKYSGESSMLIYDVSMTFVADNVSSGDSTIVRGLIRTGVVQDFTGDLFTKLDSTTALPQNRLQDTCVKKATMKIKLATRTPVIRLDQLQDVFEPFTWTNRPIFFAANWTKTFVNVSGAGIFSSVSPVFSKTTYSVPYGVLPTINVCSGMQVTHVLLKMLPNVAGPVLVLVSQPMEFLGCLPPKQYDGTWVGSMIYGQTSLTYACVNATPQSSLFAVPGQIRMYCPTSVPTIVFTGLVRNTIYAYGSALGTAPPANPVPEAYGYRPLPLQSEAEFLSSVQSAVGDTEDQSWRIFTLA